MLVHVHDLLRTFDHDRRQYAIQPHLRPRLRSLLYCLPRIVNMVKGRMKVTFLASATWQTSGLSQICRLQLVLRVKTARAMR